MKLIATFLLLLMTALGAQATPIHYAVSGQFSSGAPTTPVSAPGAVFTFEFTLTYTTPDYVDEEHGWSEYWYVPVTFKLGSETVLASPIPGSRFSMPPMGACSKSTSSSTSAMVSSS